MKKSFILVCQTTESDEFYDFFETEEAARVALSNMDPLEFNHIGVFKIEREILNDDIEKAFK